MRHHRQVVRQHGRAASNEYINPLASLTPQMRASGSGVLNPTDQHQRMSSGSSVSNENTNSLASPTDSTRDDSSPLSDGGLSDSDGNEEAYHFWEQESNLIFASIRKFTGSKKNSVYILLNIR